MMSYKGRTAPGPQASKYPVVSCRIDLASDRRLTAVADQTGRSRGSLMREAIERMLPIFEAEAAESKR